MSQSNHLANQQQESGFAVSFASLRIPCKNAVQNHVAEPNWLVLTFLHPKFVVQCNGGVALRACKLSSSIVFINNNLMALQLIGDLVCMTIARLCFICNHIYLGHGLDYLLVWALLVHLLGYIDWFWYRITFIGLPT
jgi:hypothetical protein